MARNPTKDVWSAAARSYPDAALQRRSGRRDLTEDSDGRSPFARDRDRLLYSDAFSSLGQKSQVAATTSLGPYHNRMTHSLKVGQLGRRISERISRQAKGRKNAGPDPDLVELCCLAHDIGHPPFGHTGERELAACVDEAIFELWHRKQGSPGSAAITWQEQAVDFGGFEGNPQTLRVVTRLTQKRIAETATGARSPNQWHGLDLTAAAVDAVCKYPWSRGHVDRYKWGAYGTGDDSDLQTLEWARCLTGAAVGDGSRTSFECQVMDWCDDVTYAVHDVDDFHKAGMIPVHRLFGLDSAGAMEEWDVFREFVSNRWSSAGRWAGTSVGTIAERLDEVRHDLLREVPELRADSVYDDRVADLRDSSERTSRLISHFIKNVCVAPGGRPLLHEGDLLIHPSEEREAMLRDQCRLLQEMIWMYVLGTSVMQDTRAEQRRVVGNLFAFYLERQDLLPAAYLEIAQRGSGYADPDEAAIRTTADYVSSLTEPAAANLHGRLLEGRLNSAGRVRGEAHGPDGG